MNRYEKPVFAALLWALGVSAALHTIPACAKQRSDKAKPSESKPTPAKLCDRLTKANSVGDASDRKKDRAECIQALTKLEREVPKAYACVAVRCATHQSFEKSLVCMAYCTQKHLTEKDIQAAIDRHTRQDRRPTAGGLSQGVARWTKAPQRIERVMVGERRCTLPVPRGLNKKGPFGVSFEQTEGLPWNEPTILLLRSGGVKSADEMIQRAKLKPTDKVLAKQAHPDGAAFVYRTRSGYLSARREIRPKKKPEKALAKLGIFTGGVDCTVNWNVGRVALSQADWQAAQKLAVSICARLKCE